jgi:hypothetical protein
MNDPNVPPGGNDRATGAPPEAPAAAEQSQAPANPDGSPATGAGTPVRGPLEFRDYRDVWGPSGRPPAAVSFDRKSPPWGRWLLYALAVMATLGWAIDVTFHPSVVTTLPPSVLGVWHTDVARYASRRFELQAGSVLVQTGDAARMATRHRIARVQQSPAEEGTLFTVDYEEDESSGALTTLEFIYRPAPRSDIIFPHQKEMVWTRGSIPAKAPSAPAAQGKAQGRIRTDTAHARVAPKRDPPSY